MVLIKTDSSLFDVLFLLGQAAIKSNENLTGVLAFPHFLSGETIVIMSLKVESSLTEPKIALGQQGF